MTAFKPLFKQMFLHKRRYAHLVLFVQIFAVIFIFTIGYFSGNYRSERINSSNGWDVLLYIGILTTIFSDLVFLAILCWQNEKINLSQTWQLIPTSSIKIWLTNIFSSLVECSYIFIIQVFCGFIVLIFDCLSKDFNFFNELNRQGSWNFAWSDIWGICELILYLIAICSIIFVFVSFANLLARTIIDQIPGKSTLIIKILVMVLLVIIGVFIAAKVNDQVLFMYSNHFKQTAYGYDGEDVFAISIIEYFVGTIILGFINCLLVNKFVEPKIR